ncbi:MAG: class I SAM-dependent methyltransferase [Promethearchaeota archaeon]
MFSDTETYFIVINWGGRLKRELPVLEGFISSLDFRRRLSILDLGCGPGVHLRALKRSMPEHDYTGIDTDSEMIEKARRDSRSDGLDIKYICGNLFDDCHIPRSPFDIIYSLGNSISLISGQFQLDHVIKCLKKRIREGGLLFFQVLNNEKPRMGYFPSRVVFLKNETETFVVKRFSPDFNKMQMNVEFLTFWCESRAFNYQIHCKKSGWPLISFAEYKNVLKRNGFQVMDVWGSYAKEPFNASTSDNLLLLARRIKEN